MNNKVSVKKEVSHYVVIVKAIHYREMSYSKLPTTTIVAYFNSILRPETVVWSNS